jgi:hypothetical protein
MLATRAVEYPVKSPEDAMEMFDEITYEKGGSLLRMLEMYLGEDKFQAGIQRYMQEHKFANATTGDLWQALSVESGSAQSGRSGAHEILGLYTRMSAGHNDRGQEHSQKERYSRQLPR